MPRSPRHRRFAARFAIVASATLLALALTGATPALADRSTTPQAVPPGPTVTIYTELYQGLQDIHTNYCLDSNWAGSVYTNPCQTPGNLYQVWFTTIYQFDNGSASWMESSFMDEETGRCLDSNAADQLYTSACQPPGNPYQMWIAGDSLGEGTVMDSKTGLYLDSNWAKSAYTHVPNGGDWQLWFPNYLHSV